MHKFDQRLLEFLPLFTLPEEIKERNLCARYLLPVFQAMFDDLNNEDPIMFNFVDELNNECQASDINLSRRRSGDWIVFERLRPEEEPRLCRSKAFGLRSNPFQDKHGPCTTWDFL
ncbi:hypothetical protein G6F46_005655 [Rhizopus delemar]|uniref:Uncharacterized protein n=3 Tax=Rhizopus TaxID=4842 RepID=I1CQG4_RHIO9|nr:hypothetical protein RO3G_15405 [Rhizopus delemar RA 99-880]KAG1159858.1 hypothetical protein G6F36_014047 [Rhizopus arrhizus]KAG1460369.1 hypothetical protein G6F55_004214 [Rhizopus delemar]KAG1498619.1 hypothetical protein G6F54_004962 [Rhizopus delemar]KAG1512374.1 hypothetical protein G6F53_005238 [Rhizopus delemar]|eukprot:EIE90694.1 hypothetical protein RO3G_15405 [Rhizopus delemar RA 99-880]